MQKSRIKFLILVRQLAWKVKMTNIKLLKIYIYIYIIVFIFYTNETKCFEVPKRYFGRV